MDLISIFNFILGKFTVAVQINVLKNARHFLAFFLSNKLRADESQSGSFDGSVRVEVDQVVEGVIGNRVSDLDNGMIFDPSMVHGLGSGWALLGVVSKKSRDEILGLLRDALPDGVVKVKLTLLDG